MARVKLIAALVSVPVVLVIVLQNTQPVETKFLFATLTMPRTALLAITMLIGIGVGMLIALGLSGKNPRITESHNNAFNR
ncbi:LapA family protein [bacterium]|nr:LapA family protein [bacterium]MBU1071949.1 LapA family protein [bacterium]MBU1675236.1 LapA family protein [bacterium]